MLLRDSVLWNLASVRFFSFLRKKRERKWPLIGREALEARRARTFLGRLRRGCGHTRHSGTGSPARKLKESSEEITHRADEGGMPGLKQRNGNVPTPPPALAAPQTV